MTTVFLSGSRRISRITKDVRDRIDNMVQKNMDIVTGDANGADKAMQSYLHELKYTNVTIYYVGLSPRNNVGNWPTQNVLVEGKLSGREFYSQKDRKMVTVADFGLVVWDGKSSGSVQNMLWLLSENKPVVVYFAASKRFFNLKAQSDLVEMLANCDEETLKDIGRKIKLPERVGEATKAQIALNF
jgi:hypothetical protein